MSKVKSFLGGLFSKSDDTNDGNNKKKTVTINTNNNTTSRGSIVAETQNDPALSANLEDNDDEHRDLERVDTYAGPLAKFLLKFVSIEEGYSIIEQAFIKINNDNSRKMLKMNKSKSVKSRMIVKRETKYIPNMLLYLGYKKMSNNDIETIINKDIKSKIQIDSDGTIIFRRFLILAGQIYFNFKKKASENNTDDDDGKTDNNNDNTTTNDDTNDDTNDNSNDADAVNDAANDDAKNDDSNDDEKRERYRIVCKGFDVVQNMFDYIDKDKSGFIDKQEFSKVFGPSLRGADKKKILEERMNEMDYNKDGQISFNEFIFGIGQWIKWDLDDE